jgi:hypothetical protein
VRGELVAREVDVEIEPVVLGVVAAIAHAG